MGLAETGIKSIDNPKRRGARERKSGTKRELESKLASLTPAQIEELLFAKLLQRQGDYASFVFLYPTLLKESPANRATYRSLRKLAERSEDELMKMALDYARQVNPNLRRYK